MSGFQKKKSCRRIAGKVKRHRRGRGQSVLVMDLGVLRMVRAMLFFFSCLWLDQVGNANHAHSHSCLMHTAIHVSFLCFSVHSKSYLRALEEVHAVLVAVPEATRDNNWSSELRSRINGKEMTVIDPSPTCTLLDQMREQPGLTGTHIGCGAGGCCACTVVLARIDRATWRPDVCP